MRNFTFCLLATVLLLSCSKKDNKNTTNPGNTNNPDPSIVLNDNEKLVVGTWAIELIVDSNYSGTTLVDVISGVSYPCNQDDALIFSADRTYYLNEGADTCGSSKTYGVQDWSISDGNHFNYKHGPGLIYADGTFKGIDNDHFAVYSMRFGYNAKSTLRTYYYIRR